MKFRRIGINWIYTQDSQIKESRNQLGEMLRVGWCENRRLKFGLFVECGLRTESVWIVLLVVFLYSSVNVKWKMVGILMKILFSFNRSTEKLSLIPKFSSTILSWVFFCLRLSVLPCFLGWLQLFLLVTPISNLCYCFKRRLPVMFDPFVFFKNFNTLLSFTPKLNDPIPSSSSTNTANALKIFKRSTCGNSLECFQ